MAPKIFHLGFLRLLEDREKLRQLEVEEIWRSIEASRSSSMLLTEEEVFDPLEAKYAAMAEREGPQDAE